MRILLMKFNEFWLTKYPFTKVPTPMSTFLKLVQKTVNPWASNSTDQFLFYIYALIASIIELWIIILWGPISAQLYIYICVLFIVLHTNVGYYINHIHLPARCWWFSMGFAFLSWTWLCHWEYENTTFDGHMHLVLCIDV